MVAHKPLYDGLSASIKQSCFNFDLVDHKLVVRREMGKEFRRMGFHKLEVVLSIPLAVVLMSTSI